VSQIQTVDEATKAADPATDHTAPPRTPRAGPRRAGIQRHGDVLVWIVIAAVALFFLQRQNVPRTFFFDEWTWIAERRTNGPDTWLRPHNGHLITLIIVIYRILLAVFGLNHYRPYRLVGLLAHVLVATLLYRTVRSRHGATIGVAAGALFLLLGSAWEVIYQPSALNNMGPAAVGLLAWMMLTRQTRKGDIAASVATGAAIAFGGLGIVFMLGTAARLAVARQWRRLLVVVAPSTFLYVVWYMGYGESQGTIDNLTRLPRYVVDEAASSVAGLAGRDLLWGRLALGVIVGSLIRPLFGLAVHLARRLRELPVADPSSRAALTVAPAVAMLSNWLLVGYSRADLGLPASSRYIYGGALFLILTASAAAPTGASRRAALAVVAASALGIWGNWYALRVGPVNMREATAVLRVELRAVEWAAASVDPNLPVDTARSPGLLAGQYLEARDHLGSAAASDSEVEINAKAYGKYVDEESLRASAFAPVVLDSTQVCAAEGNGAAGPVELNVASGGTFDVRANGDPVEVRLRRYAAEAPEEPQITIAAGESASFTVPADTAPRQGWAVELTSAGTITACSASPGS